MKVLTPWYLKMEDFDGELLHYRYDVTDAFLKIPIITVIHTIKAPHEYIARFLPYSLTSGGAVTSNLKSIRMVFPTLHVAKSSIDEYARAHGYTVLTDQQYDKLKCMT